MKKGKKRGIKKKALKKGLKKTTLKGLYGMNFLLALILGIGFVIKTDKLFSFFIAILVLFYSMIAYKSIK